MSKFSEIAFYKAQEAAVQSQVTIVSRFSSAKAL